MKAIAAHRHHRFAPVVLLALALLVTGVLYAAFSPSSAQAAAAPSEDDLTAGSNLFRANCSTCHGVDAAGRDGIAPSLIGVGAAAVDFQVSTGRMPMMANGAQAPSKVPIFTDEQIRQMAAWVASLGAGPSVPSDEAVDPALGDAANGMELFRTNCAMCHGSVGQGGALSQGKYAPNLSESAPRTIYEAMVTGPQSMPVFNDATITPEEKRDIIAYLDAQQQGSPGGLTLGSLGPVAEGLWAWVIGIGLLIGAAVWIGAKSS
ncbi:c-type cytochrome [Actinotalea sp. M2MS4P-6]|uniref:cytochrome bc1 complex diheme cytochrome c subunit n=1 Tax=Actinotalea sp. M2MS4P-6 TaxID=2983762 RepID=UPI0021E4D36A|nr:c-type cytochrome [Actinotalea sp. M2MS4P-6]MCV2396456.1 c-type cytochrome [Actinotalea sp. M2MS4P-6]